MINNSLRYNSLPPSLVLNIDFEKGGGEVNGRVITITFFYEKMELYHDSIFYERI